MKKKEILLEQEKGLVRVALLEDGQLCEYYFEREGAEKEAGNIYKGRVQNVLRGMQAAFVDIGTERNAFLSLSDPATEKSDLDFDGEAGKNTVKRDQQAPKSVKIGQEIMVQVVKEQDATKGARITTNITLPGKYLVLTPFSEFTGVSRRIQDEKERLRLKKEVESVRPEGMGLIVRTAAEGVSVKEFASDVESLLTRWKMIEKRFRMQKGPSCIHKDDSLICRTVRDLLSPDVSRLVAEKGETYNKLREYLSEVSTGFADRLVPYEGQLRLFDVYSIDSALDKAMQRKVWLKNGGYLYVEETEALTVVDVNTGKFVGGINLQDTVFRLNCEAAVEIARQIRLRDIGGIVIIDFIDMESQEHRQQVLNTLRSAFEADRNKTNIVGWTGLGLVEMTRKKERSRLSERMEKRCPCCDGTGKIPQEEQTARQALREVQRILTSGTEKGIVLSAGEGILSWARKLAPRGIYLGLDEHAHLGEYTVTVKPEVECVGLERLE